MKIRGLRIPAATYRLQFNRCFGFDDARQIVPYLHALGITDIYASPYFKARPGSNHGYDVLDQNYLNPEVGTDEEHTCLCNELKCHNMGQVLDIVPNHMCVEGENGFWMDLLENGPSSIQADFFDVDWHPAKKELENKILIPILGDQYGTVLENGELSLQFDEGAFVLRYYDHKLPIIPKTYSIILAHRIEELEQSLSGEAAEFHELMSIITALKHLPLSTERDPELIAERYREKEVVKRRLWAVYQEYEAIGRFIDGNVDIFNGTKGVPESYDLLDGLLQEQVYRISHWRVATEEINYRRFFDINSLGAIRVENPTVFEKIHQMILKFIGEGKITGLRVDHADGLRDPAEYFCRLQKCCFLELYRDAIENSQTTGENNLVERLEEAYESILQADPCYRPFYIIGEKILLKGESLPDDWPIFGATGYSFVNQVNGLFVDTLNAKHFDALYARIIREKLDFQEVIYEKKKLVMEVAMSSEINMLGHRLNNISETNRHTRDFTLNSLTKAIVEVIASFPVYRTYINSFDIAERDRQYIETAINRARRKNPAISSSVFDFFRDILLLRFSENLCQEHRDAWLDFVMRFQQISGPVMAKGVEDTAFYSYNRLVSMNEVGGSPERFGVTLDAFHGQNIQRAKARPFAMLATSTHDTKRSEDVRARINVLSEMPEIWKETVIRWSRLNRKCKMSVDGQPAPDRNEEYLLYQTLLGAWPFCRLGNEEFTRFRVRIKKYMLKSMREAKVHTSWNNPNSLYEDAVLYFVDSLLTESPHNGFLHDIESFQKITSAAGMINSLAQTLLKITSPGIPDFYQGSELWNFSLVDPDNRQPIDFSVRSGLLTDLVQKESSVGTLELVRELMATPRDGRIKLYLTWKALNHRRANRELFESGRYLPLAVEGVLKDHVCAFERSTNNRTIMVIVSRFHSKLLHDGEGILVGAKTWGDTRVLQPFAERGSSYRNIFTGEVSSLQRNEEQSVFLLADVLVRFPVALLESTTEMSKTT
ncbi:MAG: malto-oligosyltrehalose synthase [Geobacter sp.]|nr:MAG: malto-oligosyltrehalose synthase [Geobacter sp.]